MNDRLEERKKVFAKIQKAMARKEDLKAQLVAIDKTIRILTRTYGLDTPDPVELSDYDLLHQETQDTAAGQVEIFHVYTPKTAKQILEAEVFRFQNTVYELMNAKTLKTKDGTLIVLTSTPI